VRALARLAAVLAVSALACGSTKAVSPGAAGTSGTAGTSGAAGGTGGNSSGATGAAGDVDAGGGDTIEIDGGACTAVIAQHPDEGAQHVDCVPVPTYGTKPPSSGNHYPIWADFKTYTTPVPWGHLVHDLEHGAIVIVYNCPGGCPDEVARAQAMIDGLPFPLTPADVDVADGFACVAPTKHRMVLAPDPTLDVRWAASAWTWTLRSSCFDEATFGDFAKAHYAKAGENFCIELHEPFCDVP
jgi:uncharacterized protein DUF3105